MEYIGKIIVCSIIFIPLLILVLMVTLNEIQWYKIDKQPERTKLEYIVSPTGDMELVGETCLIASCEDKDLARIYFRLFEGDYMIREFNYVLAKAQTNGSKLIEKYNCDTVYYLLGKPIERKDKTYDIPTKLYLKRK